MGEFAASAMALTGNSKEEPRYMLHPLSSLAPSFHSAGSLLKPQGGRDGKGVLPGPQRTRTLSWL
jgi:hypothetical protein